MSEIVTSNALLEALAKSQLEIQAPAKDKFNKHFQNHYSSLDSIYAACRIPLAKNGLTISHSIEDAILVTTLRHSSGGSLSNKMPMFIKNLDSQGFGAALTYARRYAICSLLALPTEDDDDGNLATDQQRSEPQRKPEPPKETVPISDDEVEEILRLIGDDQEFLKNVLKSNGKKSIYEIPKNVFPMIRQALLARKRT